MTRQLTAEVKDDLAERGYSRRQIGAIAAVFGLGAGAAAISGRPAWAKAAPSEPTDDDRPARVRIALNELWTGPTSQGQAAAAAIIASCNRYEPKDEHERFRATVAKVEGVPADHVSPWPGSSDPLSRTIVTYCSPARALVTADPTFELPWMTAQWLGAPVVKIPLTPDHRHDVRAMLKAHANPGVFYICSPNNPTGTLTPLEDVAWLAANKPDGSVLLVDEAYIHFAGEPSAARLVTKHKGVVVLRTFSKIFGMAGMRMGYMMTTPDRIETMQRYDGGMLSHALPLPSQACATASLTAFDQIAERRRLVDEARAMTFEHLKRRGLSFVPSRANMFMVDWKTRQPKAVQAAFRAQGVDIGRSWTAWPSMSRITVGSMADMKAFCAALDKVLA